MRMIVFVAIYNGHANGRALSAYKIAQILDIPRTTVLRSIDDLIEYGLVERHTATTFRVAPSMAQRPFEKELAAKYARLFVQTAEVVRRGT
jgi:predicted transcriptional regulator